MRLQLSSGVIGHLRKRMARRKTQRLHRSYRRQYLNARRFLYCELAGVALVAHEILALCGGALSGIMASVLPHQSA